jgi:hypothetical protein
MSALERSEGTTMSAVIYAVAMAASVAVLRWLMNAWARRMWGKAYDKPIAMGEMMAKVGVEPEAMAGMRGQTVAAARRCADCRNEAECRDFLDGKTNQPISTFCPNAELFDALKK